MGASASEKVSRTNAVSGRTGSAVADLPTNMSAGAAADLGSSRSVIARTVTDPVALLVVRNGGPRCQRRALAGPRSPIGVAVFSMPDEPTSLAVPQPARVPPSTTNPNSCHALILQPPSRSLEAPTALDSVDRRIMTASSKTRKPRPIIFWKLVAQIQRGSRRVSCDPR